MCSLSNAIKFICMQINLIALDNEHTTAQILCNIDINPILKAMVSKPLNELFNYMANKIEKAIKLGELD